MKKLVDDGLVLHATIVVIIGSRHILLWNMIEGELDEEPILLGNRLVKRAASIGIQDN